MEASHHLIFSHKEVGASFYMVREIVQDIIQENRVLGPGKFTLVEHPSDQVLDQDLIGSIAVDPNTYFTASPNENQHVHSNLQDTSDKMLYGQHTRVDVRNKEFNEAYENGNVINGSQVDETNQELVEAFSKGNLILSSQVDETNKESVEASTPDFQVSESLATLEDVTQNLALPKTNLSPVTANVIVETFPLRSVTSSAIGIESSGEFTGITNSPENETKNLGLHIGKNLIYMLRSLWMTLEIHLPLSLSKVNSQTISGAKTKIQDGFHTKTLTLNFTDESNTKEERQENLNERRVNGQLGDNSQKINPTLERINLESWDGKPKNSMKQEVNPILAVFRAFVDAFVKFCSE
ncbi:hypothetical protein K1719_029989 [Acacia pycnantha]|nr:hypothetical protein K1719_029989 [Acacia pycnantha]